MGTVKKKDFTPEQQRYMKNAGLDYRYYDLVNDQTCSMLVRNKQTNIVLLVRKQQNPKRLGS